ncbi:MAG TPA: VOC family protein [Propionibacteriaceae bacterium]
MSAVTVMVRDYDEAIEFFTRSLGLHLIADQPRDGDERFVVVGAGSGADLLLARAATAEERDLVGRQTAGRVGFILRAADFFCEHRRMVEAGVVFEEEPRYESYGTVAVFSDLYGNRWDLIQPHD